MALDITDRIVRNNDLLTSDMDGDLVMLSIENGKYYGMNAIGRRIWLLLDKPMAVGEVCDVLTSEFAVSRAQCEQDVLPFIVKLIEKNIIYGA